MATHPYQEETRIGPSNPVRLSISISTGPGPSAGRVQGGALVDQIAGLGIGGLDGGSVSGDGSGKVLCRRWSRDDRDAGRRIVCSKAECGRRGGWPAIILEDRLAEATRINTQLRQRLGQNLHSGHRPRSLSRGRSTSPPAKAAMLLPADSCPDPGAAFAPASEGGYW